MRASGAGMRRGVPDGSWPSMQERESLTFARSPLEALLARQDDEAHAWLVERLMAGDEIEPTAAPAPLAEPRPTQEVEVSG